jgi:hypothetical protein
VNLRPLATLGSVAMRVPLHDNMPQLVGFMLKISCATPVLGPTVGLLGVGLASALAGQASKHTQKMVATRSSPFKPGFWEPLVVEDIIADAALGVFSFKVAAAFANNK